MANFFNNYHYTKVHVGQIRKVIYTCNGVSSLLEFVVVDLSAIDSGGNRLALLEPKAI